MLDNRLGPTRVIPMYMHMVFDMHFKVSCRDGAAIRLRLREDKCLLIGELVGLGEATTLLQFVDDYFCW